MIDSSVNGPEALTVDFKLNDEQLEFQEHCRRFAREVIRPAAAKHDREESVPWEVIKAAREWNLHGLETIQQMGSDPDGLFSCIYAEELHWGCAGIALAIQGGSLAAAGIASSGTPEQIGLSGIASERQLLRFDLPPINFSGSFTVSRGGQNTAQISSTATRPQVQAAIETLPGLAGNIVVGGAPGGWIVTFTGALAGTDVPLLSGTVTDNSSQEIAVTGTGGTYKIEFGGVSTGPLPFDDNDPEADLRVAIEAYGRTVQAALAAAAAGELPPFSRSRISR